MTKYHKDHVLIIADTHCPYDHKHYLSFLKQIQDRVKCGTVVHIGDGVDNSAFSFKYNPDPDLPSPKDEIAKARKSLQKYFHAFPKVKYCLGNHCRRVNLKGRHNFLPQEVFRPFRDIWGLPGGWEDDFSHEIDGVLYQHGHMTGDMAHIKQAIMNRQSTVTGHTHSVAAVNYLVSRKDRLLAMGVGSGIDNKNLCFSYGKDALKKPVVSCGVVTDHGRYGQIFPMEL